MLYGYVNAFPVQGCQSSILRGVAYSYECTFGYAQHHLNKVCGTLFVYCTNLMPLTFPKHGP